jgi:ABC-type Mn2+/Zn2+ transport system ATPase subunit
VEEGHRLGILGQRRRQSTLLKVTLGLLTGYEGSVRVFGMPPE